MAENVNDPLSQRLAQIEKEGKAQYGEHWDATARGLERAMLRSDDAHISGSDALTSEELRQRVCRPDAAARLFADGISNASEEDWRAWRDAQPHRKARIDRTR